MLQIRIIQPGSDEVVHEVQGRQAVIGRAPDSDVVIPERYISARHAKVISGLVVVDMDSTNGTFVDGSRVREATLLRDGEFQLGGEVGDARIRIVEVAGSEGLDATFSGGTTTLREELAAERTRSGALQARLRELEGAAGPGETGAVRRALEERVGQLEADKAELQARIARLQRELEAARG